MKRNEKYLLFPVSALDKLPQKCTPVTLYSLILLRSRRYGYCYEPDDNFADWFGVTRRTISTKINMLKKLGLIRIENPGKRNRRIYPLFGIEQSNDNSISDENDRKNLSKDVKKKQSQSEKKTTQITEDERKSLLTYDTSMNEKVFSDNNDVRRESPPSEKKTTQITEDERKSLLTYDTSMNEKVFSDNNDVRRKQSQSEKESTLITRNERKPLLTINNTSINNNINQLASLADELETIFEKIFGRKPNKKEIGRLARYLDKCNLELIEHALEKAAENEATSPAGYTSSILDRYISENINTMDDVVRDNEKFHQAHNPRRKVQGYSKANYTSTANFKEAVQIQSYRDDEYNHGGRANVQETLPSWVKPNFTGDENQPSPEAIQVKIDRARVAEKQLQRAVKFHQQLFYSDLETIRNNLSKPDGHGYMSENVPKLFEQYLQQQGLEFKTREEMFTDEPSNPDRMID